VGRFPDTGDVPLISDMSSDIFSRPFDANRFGLDLCRRAKEHGAGRCLPGCGARRSARPDARHLPTMLKYTTHVEKNSMFNTPPCFAVYTAQLVLKWLEETVGGLDKMAQINQQKAACSITSSTGSDFYRGTADKDSRSLMNVTFRLPDEALEKKFVAEAAENELGGLKGHRSVGGCRASIYNATSLNTVEALVDFMKGFASRNG
jgi:phosphoserine aminotransferase